jgi:hypothetical protein
MMTNIQIRKILQPLVLLACMHPIPGTACAVLPNDKDAERTRQIVEEAKAATSRLKDEADLIFIGYLKTLDVEQKTVDTPNGPQVMQFHRALFDPMDDIKGHYPKGQALEFTVNKNEVWVSLGCRPQYWQLPKENGAGEVYLVYARDGKVLRTNHIPMDRQAMSGYEEAAFVRGR